MNTDGKNSHRRVIPKEEAMLTETFGEKYDEYRKSVRRWIQAEYPGQA